MQPAQSGRSGSALSEKSSCSMWGCPARSALSAGVCPSEFGALAETPNSTSLSTVSSVPMRIASCSDATASAIEGGAVPTAHSADTPPHDDIAHADIPGPATSLHDDRPSAPPSASRYLDSALRARCRRRRAERLTSMRGRSPSASLRGSPSASLSPTPLSADAASHAHAGEGAQQPSGRS